MDLLESILLIQSTRERTVPLVVASLLVLFGLLLVADQIWWRRRALAVRGRVKGFLAEAGEPTTLYRTVVELVLPGGRALLGKDDSASSSLIGREIGQEVEVLVTREDFPTVRIHRRGRIQLGVALMLAGSAMGAVL